MKRKDPPCPLVNENVAEWCCEPGDVDLIHPYGDTLGYVTSYQLSPKQRERFIKNMSNKEIKGFGEMCRCLTYVEELDPEDRKKMKEHVETLKEMANPKTKIQRKRELMQRASHERRGGFMGALATLAVPFIMDAAKVAIHAINDMRSRKK